MSNSRKGIAGKRIYLRPFTGDDIEWYYEALLQQESSRLTGTKKLFSKEVLQNYLNTIAADSARAQFVITLQDDDRPIGEIAIMDMDPSNRSGHIRIAIFAEEDCGQGYGSEAMILMLDYGFGMMNLNRIELVVFSYNARAVHAYEKVGFVQEGIQREALYYNHKYHDSIMMSMLAREFRERHGNPAGAS
ncbi:acetyltransferase [Paenibacillus alvei TS-15]|jgi:RimJ/RimL family protein N-acetyltransferase|uniref:Acetyltransferase n=1 Tax=Paenibacillus alvei TS-15 TaxID=1117108 RepID=S9SWJ0_PAEAL|nr:GNAT family protein [Paenibacillus alvei]EPY09004.1 acetyltransferase [Paenibacillus alvei TS-15]